MTETKPHYDPHQPVSKEELAKALKGMIQRVGEQTRAEEARFVVEHDGSSSAEYYGESGTNDHMDELRDDDEEEE